MRRYAFRDGRLVELDLNYVPQPRVHIITDRAYESLTPVITSMTKDKDGNPVVEKVDISTRARHRQYMKDHDLALYDDMKPDWDRAEKERADFARAAHNDATLREDLERAMYRVFDAPGIEERKPLPDASADTAVRNEDGSDSPYPVVSNAVIK